MPRTCLNNIEAFNRKMMKFLLSSERKRAAQKLTEIGVVSATRSPLTVFRKLALVVVNEVLKGNRLNSYLSAMTKELSTPDLLLKYAVFIHLYLQ